MTFGGILLALVTVYGSADFRSANITRGSIVNPEPIQCFTGYLEFGGGDRNVWYGEDALGARVWTCNHLTASRDHQMPRCFNETDPYIYFRNRTGFADGWSLMTESGLCWVLYKKFKDSDAPLSETEWRVRQELETPWVTPYWFGRYTFRPYDLVYWQTGLKRTFAPWEGLTLMPFGFLDWGDHQLFAFKYGLSQGEFHGGVSAIDIGVRGNYAVTEWFGIWAQVDGYWLVNQQARQANRDRGGITSRNEICVFSLGIEFRF